MASIQIITNNPLVWAAYPNHSVIVDGGVKAVYTAVRDKIHRGAMLLSHPLSGSVKPNVSPAKSVIIGMRQGEVDEQSLKYIEEALAVFLRMPERHIPFTEDIIFDYQTIDKSLLDSGLQGLPVPYRM